MSATEETTQKVEEKVTETVEKIGKSVEQLVDRVADNQDRMITAARATRDRTRRLSDEYLQSVTAAQTDAIALTKTIVSHPTAYAKNIEAAMESMTAAQARLMDLSKVFYREQAEATAELKEQVAPLFESNPTFANFTKAFESFMPKTA